MYAIGNIIYGIPYSEEILAFFENNESLDPAEYFEFVYSGSGDIPAGWCGVLLDSISEGNNTSLKELELQPSEENVEQVKEKFNKLPHDIKKICLPIDVYLVWSTS